jgi:hypothetical protein
MSDPFKNPKGKEYLGEILGEITKFGPPVQSEQPVEPPDTFKLIITTDEKKLGGGKGDENVYVGSCNLNYKVNKEDPENTIYLHPYFFELPQIKQLEILYYLLISVLTKRIESQEEALKDAKMFIDYYRSSQKEKRYE